MALFLKSKQLAIFTFSPETGGEGNRLLVNYITWGTFKRYGSKVSSLLGETSKLLYPAAVAN